MDVFWIEKPEVLFKGFMEFVPQRRYSVQRNFNAATRFCIYLFIALGLLMERQPLTTPVFMATALGLFYYFHTSHFFTPAAAPCTAPTIDNPFMNITHADYYQPDRPPACANADPEPYFRNNLYENEEDFMNSFMLRRPFYTKPVSTIPNDQSAFAHSLHPGADPCKNDSYCDINMEITRRNAGGIRTD